MTDNTKRELYNQLSEKLSSYNEKFSALNKELKEILKFADDNNLIILDKYSDSISICDKIFNIDHNIEGSLAIPTDKQIAEGWTSSRYSC